MIPNYIGESLAALIPAILSLIQGLGEDKGCHNVTNAYNNGTDLVPVPIEPVYSVRIYFLLLFLLLCISTTSFSLLNFSSIAKRARTKNPDSPPKKDHQVEPVSSSTDELEFNVSLNNSKEKILSVSDKKTPPSVATTDHTREKIILLTVILGVSFICYGVLPGKKP